jgi:NAD(P)-dependent dehydrogenase (short-subunit alcohol dehydrogenase family)
MANTILITGTSSGIGLETALYFASKGWNVVATMRNPSTRTTALHGRANIDLVHLDVTDPASITEAIRYARGKYGTIHALVNNAGYALMGPFESTGRERIETQFKTNVYGLMEVTRAMLPLFREEGGGVVVNISSIGGKNSVPLYAAYNSTKWAVEGFTESLYYEMLPYRVRVKLVEPGFIMTGFTDAQDIVPAQEWGPYATSLANAARRMENFKGSPPRVVAKTVYRAVTAKNNRLRYACGATAKPLVMLRRLVPERLFLWIFSMTFR